MKRIIPFLLLAVAFGACQDEGPTVPSDGPLLAVDCAKRPEHPKCPPEPEPDKQYSAIDLKLCKRCDGGAHDISEPDGGPLHVVGWINEPMGWPHIAVVWTGTLDNIGEATAVILSTLYPGPGSGSPGVALGINDDATSIVGRTYAFEKPILPVIWEADGSGWKDGQVLQLGEYDEGNARDVNDNGLIVGRMTRPTSQSGSDTVAAVWSSPTDVHTLYTPEGFFSAALGLNNHGDVVGRVWNGSGAEQAVLWTGTAEGDYCPLNPTGSESVAWRVEDRDAGTILVAGEVTPAEGPGKPAVWTVGTCPSAPSPELIDSPGTAVDVRGWDSGWEAVGVDKTGREARPIVWFDEGASTELLHGKYGVAYVISGAGHILGYRERKGHTVPVLWKRTN